FQRVFNHRMGFGGREHDQLPYRAMGPVTEEEYLSRAGRYDKQLTEKVGLNISAMSTADKIAALRCYRQEQYQKLCDAVYKRRGWTANAVPTPETLRKFGIDYPEVMAVVERALQVPAAGAGQAG
ncbi:MAG: aldehyde ferredoxin oxidoreductase C-terminal domain-containing protein, partial [Negativicutes bacterium]|nr:aldehyde ferredoxin oxidoreductase C-terminal domain-containing protein [Negativicutes bacterium]